MPEGKWALILNGGAKTIKPEAMELNRAGCLAAAEAGQDILRRGGSAVDAVEATIRVLEELPVFNAGYGSVPTVDHEVEMDAAIMDGRTLDVGGVAALQGVRHPIAVARALLREEWILLVGQGARQFAGDHGLELVHPFDLVATEPLAAERATEETNNTVGCIALDVNGNICAGTSTGGLDGQIKGRVGDSPLPGCGFYADNRVGAVALSGSGEKIARKILAARIMRNLEDSSPSAAAAEALRSLEEIDGEAGIIAMTSKGEVGVAHNSDHFALAVVTSDMAAPRVGLTRQELEDLIDHG
jgi:beta-aspartyl-peptidase (threonine type)